LIRAAGVATTVQGMGLKLVQFLALILTALALVPSGAHLFELPNKIGLTQEQYFTVQAIYRGWALFGIVLIPAAAANLLLAIVARRERKPFWLALTAGLCLAGTLAIFFAWILSSQPGHRQLDPRSGELDGTAGALGICARRQCGDHLRGAVRGDAVGVDVTAGLSACERKPQSSTLGRCGGSGFKSSLGAGKAKMTVSWSLTSAASRPFTERSVHPEWLSPVRSRTMSRVV
jgi:hypothetical protein